MTLGLNFGAWLFWANVLVLVLEISWAAYLRRMPRGITAAGIVISAAAIGFVWMAQGSCVLPQPTTVEFRQGMRLCPGQETIMRIETPVPSSDRNI